MHVLAFRRWRRNGLRDARENKYLGQEELFFRGHILLR